MIGVIIQLKCKIRSASTNDFHARGIIEILRDETMMKKTILFDNNDCDKIGFQNWTIV